MNYGCDLLAFHERIYYHRQILTLLTEETNSCAIMGSPERIAVLDAASFAGLGYGCVSSQKT